MPSTHALTETHEAAAGEKTPPTIAVDAARHSAVVVLVDPEMIVTDGWDTYVAALWEEIGARPQRHRLFPVAFDTAAYQLSPKTGEVNFIRLQKLAPDGPPPFCSIA